MLLDLVKWNNKKIHMKESFKSIYNSWERASTVWVGEEHQQASEATEVGVIAETSMKTSISSRDAGDEVATCGVWLWSSLEVGEEVRGLPQ